MGQTAAKQCGKTIATDIRIIMIPTPVGTVPTSLPHPFTGIIIGNLTPNVKIMGRLAATAGSTAQNASPHIPQVGPFQKPPPNMGTIQIGSPTVMINGKPVARSGDTAITCNDPADLPVGVVVAVGTVLIG